MSSGTIDAICGAISGLLTNILTHPLDTLKCRMQTEGSKKGMISLGIHILKNEHFLGFYKGFFANSIINVPVSSLVFSVFGMSKRYMKEKKISKKKSVINFMSGCIAGM